MSFGSKAVDKERDPLIELWRNPPDYETSKETFTRIGIVRAEIRILRGNITKVERKSRNGSRTAAAIDNAKRLTEEETERLLQLEAELDVLEAKINWLDYHKEIAKLIGFSLR